MHRLIPLLLASLCVTVALSAPQFAAQLLVNAASTVINAETAPVQPLKDAFGPGLDGVRLGGNRDYRSQVQWQYDGPEGDYYPAVVVKANGYLYFSEFYTGQAQLYHNDRWLTWDNHSEPVRPEGASDGRYQAEMRVERPLRVRPGDWLRVVYPMDGADLVVGPLRLYSERPADGVQALETPNWGRPESYCLKTKWVETKREGDTIQQTCELYNPGNLPRRVTLDVLAKDYGERVLLQDQETLEIPPCGKVNKAFAVKPGDSHRVRLTVVVWGGGVYPPQRLCKYFVSDVTEQPRPTFCLNGDWEMCFVPGAEPGEKPPAEAKWQAIKVPSVQPNKDGHCAWYRRTFEGPAHLQGERILLRFDQAMSEGWVYLNGQQVGHELHGSQPFLLDVSGVYQPGQPNELLVAVRDWISYSPKNLDRVARGEEPIFKDGMVDVAGYNAASNLGLGGPVYLEARPAVAVEDVFIVTSVRNKKLTLRYRLRNDSAADQDVALNARVLDAGQTVKQLPALTVKLPARQTVIRTVEIPWADAKLWWPESPYLYLLQTDLKPGSGSVDRYLVRFGFRELWIDGISFILNGVRTKIRSQWASGAGGGWVTAGITDPGERLAALWPWQQRWINEGAHQLTRTHGQAGVQEICDVADESGLMIKVESECNQANFTFDQRFWNAVIAHELRVMDVYKNHAAVVMWSAGNENMWGWIYQGEAAKVLGNRWQIKIVKAMREFDLMRRPVEWEADGDLMGGWEHHALHYPREITGAPDIPPSVWWGPLDGKTLAPYSMGPITLGQKPLTVGEAFWPATLQKPLGATVIVGDEAYQSTQPYGRAWLDSCRFLTNGFRDVEFALIDTYDPPWMQEPQTIILKQEDRAFYGGRKLRRDLNIHNDVKRPANLLLKWSLLTGGKQSGGGDVKLAMAPAELKRVPLDVPLPVVTAPTEAELRLELLAGGTPVHVETRGWRLYPAAKLQTPAGLKLSVYDPVGETAAALKKAGVTFTALTQLKAPAGGALLIGRDALKQAPEGPWREELTAFVRGGGKVALLEQSEPPDFLPVPLTPVRQKKTTMAYARAADHPLLAGLGDWELRWWTPDHYVSAGNYRKPTQGNFLPLVDVGSGEGILETPLLEEYDGRGCIVVCQMLLTDRLGMTPQADVLMQNLLNYLGTPEPFRSTGGTALFAGAEAPVRKALADNEVAYEDLTGKAGELQTPRYAVAVVDVASGLEEPLVAPLRQFAESGGHVLLHRATPEKQKLVEAALGCGVRFLPVRDEPDDIQNHVIRGPNEGLLAGISNHDLYWATTAYYNILRHEGNWWSAYYEGCPPAEMIADYYCSAAEGAQARKLTRPGTLLQAPVGKGYVVLSQLRLDEPVPDCAVTVARLRSLLFTNLGCQLKAPGGAQLARKQRLARYDFFPIDLSPFTNRGLTEDKASGLVAWTNQGENDMRALPTGRQVFEGIPFQIMSPKGAVVLYSTNANNADLPKEAKGIRVGRRADVLFFLHSVAWGSDKPFQYQVNYEDGTSVPVPILNGQQIIDWWGDPVQFAESLARGGGFIAWRGDNPMRKNVVLPGYEWTNPHPEKAIRDVDFMIVPESGSVPVLVAITGAVSRPREGVVTGVIGTGGVKVQLGTQVEEIMYIGVVGLPADHPYYEKAVAAHKAMLAGQRVQIVDDVVTQNTAGQRIGYVYLGDVFNINNLANARIIGDGLGKLGNFEGNSRQRMYLDNLGFIAQQRKAGLWGVSGQ